MIIPTTIPALENVAIQDVAVGAAHTVFLSKDGEVFTSGLGTHGQLGHGDMESISEPRLIEGIIGRAKGIAAGDLHTLIVMDGGLVYSFGSNQRGQLGLGGEFEKERFVVRPEVVGSLIGDGVLVEGVGAGDGFSVFRSRDGGVYTGGWGDGGRLGHGGEKGWLVGHWEGDGRGVPRVVKGLKDVFVDGVFVGGGRCFVTGDGRVWGWGYGGDGRREDSGVPVEIVGLRGKGVEKIAVGPGHCLALDQFGGVWAWGGNDHGCLGVGEGRAWKGNANVPERLEGISGVTDVAAGWHVSGCVAGVRSDIDGISGGKVLTWGCGQAGALGLEEAMMDFWEPTEVFGISAKRIVCGVKQMFAF